MSNLTANAWFFFIKHDKCQRSFVLFGITENQYSMSVIYLLLSLSLGVAIVFFIGFIISVKSGQYDDSYTRSVRMLFEDELVKEPNDKIKTEKHNQTK